MGMTRDILIEQEDYYNSVMTEEELAKKADWLLEQEEIHREVSIFRGFQKIMNNARICQKK